MAVSKVVYGNTTVIDITDSTVNANNLLSGNKAYGADGEPVFGALTVGSTINVTTSDTSLFGETLTLSKGQTTLTTTFDNSGEATFTSVLLTGTLTLSCAGFSMTISVPSYDTYNVEFTTVPNGKVVTPTDDIQIWLACAGITDKSYTTLAEVLADRATFETLIADSNACDYMARSTTWAGNNGVTYNETAMALIGKYDYCSNALLGNATWASAIANSDYFEYVLNVKVPTMTSNTTPSGECFGDSVNSSYDYWKAFDKNTSTFWLSGNTFPHNLGYEFTQNVKVVAIDIKVNVLNGNARAKNFKVQSYDGSDWVDLYTDIVENSDSVQRFSFINGNSCSKYRVYFIDTYNTSVTNCGIFELQFYGRAEKAIYSPKVPTMTSDTQPSGEAVGSTADSGLQLYRMFNKNSMDCYSTAPNTPTTGFYAGYKFDTATVINKLSIMTTFWHTNSSSAYYDLGIYGGDSLENLTKLSTTNLRFTSTTSASAQTSQELVFENDTAYLYYVLKFESASSGINYMKVQSTYAFMIWELQFYSKASATNLVHSCANDTLYYYDSNNTAVTLCTTDENGDGIIDYGSLDAGYYTIYSTVAKDPSNLSNAYSKTVRITNTYYGHTTEAYIMPNGALYWYGNTCDWLTGGLDKSLWQNGNTSSYTLNTNDYAYLSNSNIPYQPVYYYKNNITCSGYNTIKTIAKDGGFVRARVGSFASKSTNTMSAISSNTIGTSYELYSAEVSSYQSSYPNLGTYGNSVTLNIQALWLE